MSINVTEKAVNEIKRVMKEQNISDQESVLEVGVVGGGCTGFQYKLGFKNKSEIDQLNSTQFSFEGLDAVVDNKSLLYLDGVTVDYHDGLDKRGFVFDNPNATKSCGCGSSFSC
jgi:iron-sulfur cluster assembly accessory protein